MKIGRLKVLFTAQCFHNSIFGRCKISSANLEEKICAVKNRKLCVDVRKNLIHEETKSGHAHLNVLCAGSLTMVQRKECAGSRFWKLHFAAVA